MRIALIIAGSFIFINPAFALGEKQAFEVSVFTGQTVREVPGDRVFFCCNTFRTTVFSGGWSLGGRFGYTLHQGFGLEAAYRYTQNRERQVEFCTVCSPSESEIDSNLSPSHNVSSTVVYALRAGRFTPFLAAGVGVELFDYRGRSVQTKLSWNVGAGMKWYLHPELALRVDVTEAFLPDFVVSGKTERLTDIQAGLAFKF